jgi:hypothetical protein
MTRPDLLQAMLVALILVSCFLSSALLAGRFLSPADLLLDLPPWAGGPLPEHRAGNLVIGDSVEAFEPWRIYAARRFHEGSVPVWNPDNMLGAPFVGNSQTAVFYPLNWIFDLIPSGHVFVLLLLLKLFLCCIGVYLFARQVARVGHIPAITGMIAYSFGAFMSVWLLFPLSDATLWLPWTLWATSRLLQQPSLRRLGILALVAGMSLLAGHAETQLHVALATGLFALVETFRVGPFQLGRIVRGWGMWGLAYMLAFCLGSVELLPFAEYLSNSAIYAQRTNTTDMEYQPAFIAWTLFSPRIYGTPQSTAQTPPWGPGYYNETNTYCGVLMLLLAPFALLIRNRKQRWLALILVIGALMCLSVIYRGPIFYELVRNTPFLRLLRNIRLVFVLQFILAILGALGLDAIMRSRRNEWWKLIICAGASAALVLLVGGLYPWLNASNPFPVPAGNPTVLNIWHSELLRGVSVTLVGVTILLVGFILWQSNPRRARQVLIGLPLVLFLDLWHATGTYNPAIEPAFYFPVSPQIAFLQKQIGLARFAAQGFNLPPNTNLVFGLADLRGYDAIMPLTFRELGTQIDGGLDVPGPRSMQKLQSPLLNLLNVRYLLVPPDDKADTMVIDLAQEEHLVGTDGVVGPIAGSGRPGQTFVATSNNMSAIQVAGATYGRPDVGHIVFHLKTDPASPTDIVKLERDVTALADNAYWSFDFPPIPDSAGKHYYFYLESPDSVAESAVTVFASKENLYAGGTRMADGVAVSGDLAFRVARATGPDDSWMRVVWAAQNGQEAIIENVQAQPRAWLTHRVMVQPDKAERLRSLRQINFDYAGTVMLNEPLRADQPLPAKPPTGDEVTITRYRGEQVDISTRSTQAGVLVLADQDFPGWQVEVDGKDTPIITADHALRGVYLPAGDHTVRFHYEPVPYKIGLGLATVGWAVIAWAILGPLWLQRRRRTATPVA